MSSTGKTRVLLTGATGAVGFEVLKQLVKQHQKFHVVAFDLETPETRNKLQKLWRAFDVRFGDITDRTSVELACQGIDVVIHLAAVIPPLADDDPELAHRVNVEGTRNLITSLEHHAPNAYLLYSSSVAVYGDRLENHLITVDDPLKPSPGDEYAVTKLNAEQLIRDSELNWSIFRLSAIMGEHKMSKLMFHQPLQTKMEITTTEDAGRAFVKALDHLDEIKGRTFNLGGGEQCRMQYDEFLKRSFEIAGLGYPEFPDKTFAEHNFHCGYYADGDELNDILDFRRDDMESYFRKEKDKVKPWVRFVVILFRAAVIKRLLKQSEPYRAYINDDKDKIRQYFISLEHVFKKQDS